MRDANTYGVIERQQADSQQSQPLDSVMILDMNNMPVGALLCATNRRHPARHSMSPGGERVGGGPANCLERRETTSHEFKDKYLKWNTLQKIRQL